MMKLFLLFIALLTFVEANKLKGHTKNPKLLKQKETLVLNHENFDYALNKYDVLLVDFYAPWCPHW